MSTIIMDYCKRPESVVSRIEVNDSRRDVQVNKAFVAQRSQGFTSGIAQRFGGAATKAK
ncbi:hypothetical protein ACHOLT_12915 [Desulfitobacterium sp. Sab5]|uniref:hypothetical protein n=1 Tax=Desulfitobacterium nosdiversum TaxID=3375356 RepID=UPI003CF9B1B7